MKKTSYNYCITTSKKTFPLVALGDFHVGHINVDYEMLARTIQSIKKRECRVILMGDSIENAIPGSVSSQWESDMAPEEQIDRAYKILRPIKHLVLGLHDGNHPYRTTKATGLSPEKMLANMLGVPFLGDQALTSISVNGIVYDVYSCHGTGGGRTAAGKLTKMLNMVKMAAADIYLQGHIHDRIGYIQSYEKRVGRQVVMTKRAFMSSSSFVQYFGSYADRMLLAPGAMGASTISLGTQRFDITITL